MYTRKSVCILATGGTITMQRTAHGYAPHPSYLQSAMTNIPELKNPDVPHYVIHEFENPIDSANMSLDNWHQIAEHIKKYYADYDGFVVLHGTDTMAYTASVLSFMLEKLAKPVIFTGSQLPLFETRSDARENLINALWIAGHYTIPEVCIYFHNKLFRGNRAKKIDASSFSAFASPNFPPLASIGTDIHVRRDVLHHASIQTHVPTEMHVQNLQPMQAHVLPLFPGMALPIIQQLIQQPLKELPLQALVLQTYGAGNAPHEPSFLSLLQEAVNQGIVVINSSQCPYAKVRMGRYAVSAALLDVGIISGGDMTLEAILAKLFYLFSQTSDVSEIKKQIGINLRGELTV